MTLLTWHYEKAKLQGEKTISEQAWKEQRNRKVQNNMVSDKKKNLVFMMMDTYL